jgi:tetratricopeptide (TPR) repeat protein
MRRSIVVCALSLLPLAALFADVDPAVLKADALHDQGRYAEARAVVLDALPAASSPRQQAELYWRAARETMELGDQSEKRKEPVASTLKLFDEGEAYADKAIAADPQFYLGYYWKTANMGRWGQVKGILDSLFRAQPIKDILVKELSLNPEHSDAWFVLGQFYRELPGWPLSFGNVDAAVSLGRKAVDLRAEQFQKGIEKEIDYDFSTELAKTLYKRNWSAATRVKEQAAKRSRLASAKDLLERSFAYEGTVTLKDLSDREEARELLRWAVSELGKMQNPTASQKEDLQKARDVLAGW